MYIGIVLAIIGFVSDYIIDISYSDMAFSLVARIIYYIPPILIIIGFVAFLVGLGYWLGVDLEREQIKKKINKMPTKDYSKYDFLKIVEESK